MRALFVHSSAILRSAFLCDMWHTQNYGLRSPKYVSGALIAILFNPKIYIDIYCCLICRLVLECFLSLFTFNNIGNDRFM